jgi:hypothetical protein
MMSTTAAAESNRGRMRLKINVNVDVANHAELHANAQHVLTSTRATRPKNTTLSYEPKQREFQVRRERASIYYYYYRQCLFTSTNLLSDQSRLSASGSSTVMQIQLPKIRFFYSSSKTLPNGH